MDINNLSAGKHITRLVTLLISSVQHLHADQPLQPRTVQPADEIFNHCFFFLRYNRLDDAERLYRNLYLYQPHNPQYLTGLGIVNQMKGRYQKACAYYSLAATFGGQRDIQLLIYQGQCKMLLGEFDKAVELFTRVASATDSQPMKDHATLYLNVLMTN